MCFMLGTNWGVQWAAFPVDLMVDQSDPTLSAVALRAHGTYTAQFCKV